MVPIVNIPKVLSSVWWAGGRAVRPAHGVDGLDIHGPHHTVVVVSPLETERVNEMIR